MDEKRIIPLDYIRCIACVLVVLLHVCAYYINFYDEIQSSFWQTANAISSFTRACVPLFFMLSGFIFMSEKSPNMKNILRILSSLIFYSTIALLLFLLAKILAPDSTKMESIHFFSEPSFYHLWFLYPMLGIYICAYIINVRNINFKYGTLAIAFIFLFLNPQVAFTIKALSGYDLYHEFMIDGHFFYYLLYAILGGLFKRAYDVSKRFNNVNLILPILFIIIACGLLMSIDSYAFKNSIIRKEYLHDFTSPVILGLSFSIFYLITNMQLFKKRNLIVSFIADNSLAIYGIHAFILSIIKRLWDYKLSNPALAIPSVLLITFFISLLFAILARKIDKKRLFT